jgi:hypothetical protein
MFRSYDHTHIIWYHTRNRMQTPQIKPLEKSVFGPEIETTFVDWTQRSKHYLDTETERNLWNVVF